MSRPSVDRLDFVVLAALTGIWAGLILVADPSGCFPLNDDWSYARAVKTLLEQDRLVLTGWTSMPLLTHVLWGWLFCLPGGFSFLSLRISGLVAGWALILSVYLFLRLKSTGRLLAFSGGLVLMVTPLQLPLSLSFMTDVPFTLLFVGGVFLLDRGLEKDSRGCLAWGLVLALGATLSRQLGLAVPAAFGAAVLLNQGISRKSLALSALGLGAVVLPLVVYLTVMGLSTGLPSRFGQMEANLLNGLGQGGLGLRILRNAAICLTYLGLFLFPLLVWRVATFWPKWPEEKKRKYLGRAALFAALLSLPFILESRLMPLGGNIIIKSGLGPLTLADVHLLNLDNYPSLNPAFWWVITILSLAGGALLMGMILEEIKGWRKGRADLFAVTAIVYLAALLAVPTLFDRYLLLPTALLLIRSVRGLGASRPSPGPALFALLLVHLVLLGSLSLAGSHDYMAWNRARWKALDYVTAETGAGPGEIDGGFEYNGWFGYDPEYEPRPGKSWWWVKDDKFMIAFGEVKGFAVLKEFPFSRWLPGGQGRILVLKRRDAGDTS